MQSQLLSCTPISSNGLQCQCQFRSYSAKIFVVLQSCTVHIHDCKRLFSCTAYRDCKSAYCCCSNAEGSDAPVVTTAMSTSSSDHEQQPRQQQHTAPQQQQHQQQQQGPGTPPAQHAQMGSQQSLASHPSGESLQRVNSPGYVPAFDAAAYAAAAAARTGSPGGFAFPLMCLICT